MAAAAFKKVHVLSHGREVGLTPDVLYWKDFEFPITKKEYGAITCVSFSPVEPYCYAVTNSSRVQVYSCQTHKPEKTISKFREAAYSGRFRCDGRLLVAGGDDGLVKTFDVSTKSQLRTFKGHANATRAARFTADGHRILSCSDDATVRVWDLATEAEMCRYSEHKDYVRCGDVSWTASDIILSGSYDHSAKLYDVRTEKSVLTVNHGAPIEDVLMFPTGSLFLTAGGNSIKVWDALCAGKLLADLNSHLKTVTCLCFSSDHQRLLSGSLDRHVKVYDITSYNVVHTMDYTAPILSLAMSPDDKILAVGMSDGLLNIQCRKEPEDKASIIKKKKKPSHHYKLRGVVTHQPAEDTQVIHHRTKEKLEPYDKFFKKFEYTRALDSALEVRVRTRNPAVTVAVFQELIRREGLRPALAGRDEKSLSGVVKFLQKNISNPRFMSVLVDVSTILLDLYSGTDVGCATVVNELLQRLKCTVDQEVAYMKNMLLLLGTMDTLFAVSSVPATREYLDSLQLPSAGLQPAGLTSLANGVAVSVT